MSDSDLSYSPPPKSSKKRKAPTTTTTKSKRAKTTVITNPDPFADAKNTIREALASPDSFAVPLDAKGVRSLVLGVVEYAKSLEGAVAVGGAGGSSSLKTVQEVSSEAGRFAEMVNKGITKQMCWKPNCNDGRAVYAFDGVCPDARVFGAMLKLDGPPKLASKKYTMEEFEGMVGRVQGSVRYANLYLTSDVTVNWNESTGVFLIKGKYGKHGTGKLAKK
ncbi:hypothetical protein FS749_013404 [Ceratobasidium sp. UAMH 11750]|nr:hypothetical protein FS749_013404 [Ceratobasidium sp. UAMH 11750]